MRVIRFIIYLLPILTLFTAALRAGPPFLTDDPEPVDYQHWEAYLFATGDRTPDGSTRNGPATEVNYGVWPDVQLHLIVPFTSTSAPGQPSESGLGDMEVGIKCRFIQETADLPQVGIFPMAELPTGNSARGLGNGRTWFRLPLWLQKSFGPWTTDGGGGWALNSAPGERSYLFGGWLLQRDLGPRLTLGGEVFCQGADQDSSRGFTAFNLGGSFNFTKDFSLLFSAGRSFRGERHTLWYLALYRTWGPAQISPP